MNLSGQMQKSLQIIIRQDEANYIYKTIFTIDIVVLSNVGVDKIDFRLWFAK